MPRPPHQNQNPPPNLPTSVKWLTYITSVAVLGVALSPFWRPWLPRARAVEATAGNTQQGDSVESESPETETSEQDINTPPDEFQLARESAHDRRWNPERGTRTVAGAQQALSVAAREKFADACRKAGIAYPPTRITLLAFKEEKQLEVWAANRKGAYRKIGKYHILAASGGPGPKRREGDYQVPEGIYHLTTLNPNSQFHLSMRVDYPNATDQANRLGLTIPMGGDIYVHGNAVSIGCIAIGDPGIEELFTLVSLADPIERHILIAPVDLRNRPTPAGSEPWVDTVYQNLKRRLAVFQ